MSETLDAIGLKHGTDKASLAPQLPRLLRAVHGADARRGDHAAGDRRASRRFAENLGRVFSESEDRRRGHSTEHQILRDRPDRHRTRRPIQPGASRANRRQARSVRPHRRGRIAHVGAPDHHAARPVPVPSQQRLLHLRGPANQLRPVADQISRRRLAILHGFPESLDGHYSSPTISSISRASRMRFCAPTAARSTS